ARTGRQDSRARQGRGQRWPRASRENVAVRAPPGNGAFPVYPDARRMSDARADFLARAERGGMVPVVREVVLDGDTPLAAFVKVARPPFAFLLESLVGGERWARYTFLGTEPREVWRYRGRVVGPHRRCDDGRGPARHFGQAVRAGDRGRERGGPAASRPRGALAAVRCGPGPRG